MSADPSLKAPLPVICLAGPTGTGKTGLALEVAARLDCEIINADSRQIYADFPIITAQPTAAGQRGIAHHLYGFLASQEKISAGHWCDLALPVGQKAASRGKIALVVGGTGFYFQAALHGLAQIPQVSKAISSELAERINHFGPERAHFELFQVDPEYAAKIHPHDRQRIQRGLEVFIQTGRPFTWWHRHAPARAAFAGPLLVLGCPLDALQPRLERRVDEMLAQGAIAEAEKALEKCPDPRAAAWSGIGCAELLAHLRGEINLAEARKLWIANTRAYAKRQLTWFRSKKEAIWLSPEKTMANIAKIMSIARGIWRRKQD